MARALTMDKVERRSFLLEQTVDATAADMIENVLEEGLTSRESDGLRTGGAMAGLLARNLLARLGGMDESDLLSPGTRIGSLRIDKLLGSGGMGAVYAAFDEKLERWVAVKTLRAENRMSSHTKDRFLREARLLSKLDDPGICRIYDLVETDEADFLVLEYIEGLTLRELMDEGIELSRTLEIAGDVAHSLSVAHEASVVHRDLKPENIMITKDGQTKILDFGIARSISGKLLSKPGAGMPLDEAPTMELSPPPQLDDSSPDRYNEKLRVGSTGAILTRQGQIIGTIHFMSPEQASGQAVAEASDLYSLGVILQEMVSNKPAYEAPGGAKLLMEVIAAKTVSLDGIDAGVAELIAALLDVDPERRPSAAETSESLHALLDRPRRRRRRLWTILGTIGTLILLAVTAQISWRLASPPPLLPPGQGGRVVLLPFVNETKDASLDWIERGLTTMVAESLNDVKGLELPSADRVRKVIEDEGLKPEELGIREMQRLSRLFGAQLAIAPRLKRQNGDYVFEYRSVSSTGSNGRHDLRSSDVMAGANLLIAQMMRRLDPDASFGDLKEKFSANSFVNRIYAMGVDRLSTGGTKDALPYFQVDLDLEPEFQWAQLQLAVCSERDGQWDAADAQVQVVQEAGEKASDQRLEGAALGLRSLIAYRRDDLSAARNLATAALEIARKAGDSGQEAAMLFRLGDIARQQKALETTKKYYSASLEVYRSSGDSLGEAHSLHGLGVWADESGQVEDAEAYLKQALKLEQRLGLGRLQALTLNSLGIIMNNQGKLDEADSLFGRSLTIYRRLSSEVDIGYVLNNLASLRQKQDRLKEAIELMRQAYEISKRLPEPATLGLRAFNLAFLLVVEERPDEAETYLEVARKRFGDEWDIRYIEGHIASLKGENRRAFKILEKVKPEAGSNWSEEDEKLLEKLRFKMAGDR